MLRFNEIQYCFIVAKSSLEILAFHNLKIKRLTILSQPTNQTQKYKNRQTKSVTTSPGLPYKKSMTEVWMK